MANVRLMEGRPAESESVTWSVEQESAQLNCGPFSARINANQPAGGLFDLASGDGVRLDARLLGIEATAGVLSQPADTYVRGADFVSTQSGTNEFPFRTQAYWSAAPLSDGVIAASLTLSLQTNLLDTNPEVAVVSQLGGSATFAVRDSLGVCVGQVADDVTVAIGPHPTDAVDASAVVSGAEHRLWLRPPFLEKGVIRRFRVAALLFFGGDDERKLAQAIEEFAELPAPLTT